MTDKPHTSDQLERIQELRTKIENKIRERRIMLHSNSEEVIFAYHPTRYELWQLARDYAGIYVEEKCAEDRFGARPRMERSYKQLLELEKVLGGKEIAEVLDEEIERVRTRAGGDYGEFHLLFYGTDAEREAFNWGRELNAGEAIFAVPRGWNGTSNCDLHNHLTGEMVQQQQALTKWPQYFWLKYGPWECPDCHLKVYFAVSQKYADANFDPEQTAVLLGKVCPPRTQPQAGSL